MSQNFRRVTLDELSESIRAPKSVAIYGASSNPNKIGGRPIDYMKRFGYEGRIIPINPHQPVIQELHAYKNLRDAGGTADAVIVVLPGQLAVEAVKEAAECGARLCVVISSGFGEGGDDVGEEMLQEMLSTARKHSMRLVGPNTQGLASFENGSILSFSTLFNEYPPQDGPVGIVSQSGAMASVPYAMLRERGIGVRYAHATGNDSDLTVADLALTVLSDTEIKLLILYVENLADVEGFRRVAQKAQSTGIPVHVVYGGLSPVGQQAALSHTGALATGPLTVKAFFRRLGLWLAESIEELIDTVPLWLNLQIPRVGKIGGLSSSGAACVLISDAVYSAGLDVPVLTDSSAAKLKDRLPDYAAANNPIDVTSALLTDSAILGDSLEILNDDSQLDALVVALPVTGVGYDVERFATDIRRIQLHSSTPILSILPNKHSRAIFESHGLLVFEDTTRAVRAIANIVKHPMHAPFMEEDLLPQGNDVAEKQHDMEHPESGLQLLDEHYSGDLLQQAGVQFAERYFVENGSPKMPEEVLDLVQNTKVVVKGVTSQVSHKSDLGLVVTSVASSQELGQAVTSIESEARRNDIDLTGILIYEQVRGHYEIILGGRIDPRLGPVLMLGIGGKYAELDPDTRILMPPFTRAYVRSEIAQLRAHKIFDGFRDIPKLDVDNLIQSVEAFGRFLETNAQWVVDAEVNPLVASDLGFLAVDAVIHRRKTLPQTNQVNVAQEDTSEVKSWLG